MVCLWILKKDLISQGLRRYETQAREIANSNGYPTQQIDDALVVGEQKKAAGDLPKMYSHPLP